MDSLDRAVQSIKQGDTSSYTILIDHYQQRIYKYCFHMLGHLQEAEDATQEVFIKGLEKIGQFQDGSSFSAWIYKIAYHECLNRLKRRGMYYRLLQWFRHAGHEVYHDTYSDEAMIHPALHKALMQLKPQDRNLILLRIVEEKSFEELASLMKLSEGAVRKRYERARKKLRFMLDEQEDGLNEKFSYR